MRPASIRGSLAVHANRRRQVSRRNQPGALTSAARAQCAEAALDAMAAAAFIVSGAAQLVHWNRAAGLLLDQQDGLFVRDRHLCATDPLVQWKLQGLIASAAAQGHPATAGGILGVPRPAGGYLLQLVVLPLNGYGPRAAQVLVLVGDPQQAGSVPTEALAALYGLTAAEAQIANALLLGQSIAQIAAHRGVTSGTLRGQIKSVFRKTKTRRQSELVRLLLSVPGFVSSGE